MYRFVSGGSIMRAFAASLGMRIEEFATYNREHQEMGFDHKCDNMIRALGCQNYVVIEGRLPHVFSPHSFHVLLTCDLETRAVRRSREPGFAEHGLDDIKAMIEKRDEDDNVRYGELYPSCLWKEKDYDCIVDTGVLNPEEVVAKILGEHQKWKSSMKKERLIQGVTLGH